MHANRLLHASLGEVNAQNYLEIQMIKNIEKYKKRFGSYPESYMKRIIEIENKMGVKNLLLHPYRLKNSFFKQSLADKNISFSEDFFLVINKYWWKYPCSIDKTILKFLTKTGWMSDKEEFDRSCRLCGEVRIGREHFFENCSELKEVKKH